MKTTRISRLHSTVSYDLSAVPLFSVLIPIYNRAHLIRDCVQSVILQNYSNWEIILLDDGSTDDLDSVVKDFYSTKIRMIRLEENQGVGSAFRRAADSASGDIIGMLGSDDALFSNALDTMVKAHLKMPDCSLITSSQIPYNSRLKLIGGHPEFRPRPSRCGLIEGIENGNFATFKHRAYKRTLGFDGTLRAAVDHDIYLKLEEVGNVGFVDIPVYRYRQHDKAVSQGKGASKALLYDFISYINADKRRKNTNFPRLSRLKYHHYKSTIYFRRSQNLPSTEYTKRLMLLMASKCHRVCAIFSKLFLTKRKTCANN